MDWKEKLKLVVNLYSSKKNLEYELNTWFCLDAPENCVWPDSLPKHKGLQEFYEICGSGNFGNGFMFVPLSQLEAHVNHWIETLTIQPALTIEEWETFIASGAERHEDTIEIIKAGQHIVFMNEGDGTPWILDVNSNEVAAYYWKGGGWELAYSFDDFMEYVMSPELEEYDSGWGVVLDTALKNK